MLPTSNAVDVPENIQFSDGISPQSEGFATFLEERSRVLLTLMEEDPEHARDIIKASLEQTPASLLMDLWADKQWDNLFEMPLAGDAMLGTMCSFHPDVEVSTSSCTTHVAIRGRPTMRWHTSEELPNYPLYAPVHGFAIGKTLVLLDESVVPFGTKLHTDPVTASKTRKTDYMAVCLASPRCASSVAVEEDFELSSGLHLGSSVQEDQHVDLSELESVSWKNELTKAKVAGFHRKSGSEGSCDQANPGSRGSMNTKANLPWLLLAVDFSDAPGVYIQWGGDLLSQEQHIDPQIALIQNATSRQSFGRYNIPDGSVVTPTMRITSTTWANWAVDWDALMQEAREMASALGYDHCDYASDLLLTSRDTSQGYAGQAWVGVRFGHMNGYTDAGVWYHEVGHNFGLSHANALQSTGVSLFDGASEVEYGDPFDVMGGGWIIEGEYQAQYKMNVMGWLDPANNLEISEVNQDIILYPSDGGFELTDDKKCMMTWTRQTEHSANGVSLTWNVEHFTFQPLNEARSVDAYNGLIHRIRKSNAQGVLLDHGFHDTTMNNAPLQLGNTYTDCLYGVHVTPVEHMPCPSPDENLECMKVALRYGVEYDDFITIEFDKNRLSGNVGQELSLCATGTHSSARIVSLTWLLPDGSEEIDEECVTFTMSVPGPTALLVTASDYIGGFKSVSYPVVINGDFDLQSQNLLNSAGVSSPYTVASASDVLTVVPTIDYAPDAWSVVMRITVDATNERPVMGAVGLYTATVWAQLTNELSALVFAQPSIVDASLTAPDDYVKPTAPNAASMIGLTAEKHIVLSVSPNTTNVYVDGVLWHSKTITADQSFQFSDSGFTIGGTERCSVILAGSFAGIYYPTSTIFNGEPVYMRVNSQYMIFKASDTSWYIQTTLTTGSYYARATDCTGFDLENSNAQCTWSNGITVSCNSETHLGGSISEATFYNFPISQAVAESNFLGYDIIGAELVELASGTGCPNTTYSCADDIRNGEETDVDCGGSECGPCPCDSLHFLSGVGDLEPDPLPNLAGAYVLTDKREKGRRV
jgi:hypothetical protein